MIRRVRLLLLSLSLALSAQAAGAQEIPIKPAGADGRFLTALDPKARVPGFKPAQVAAFRGALTTLTDRIVAMPEVNSPPAPLCMRVSSYVEIQSERGLLEASIDIHRPVIVDGRCTKLTASPVQIWLNRTDSLFTSRLRQGREISGEAEWYVLPIVSETASSLRLEDDGEEIEVFTHGRAPLLRRVSMAEVTAARGGAAGSLSAAQRQAPACWIDYQLVAAPNCPLGQQLVAVNPAYFDPARPEALQVVLLRTAAGQERGEDRQAGEVRRRIWQAIDRRAISNLVR